MYEAKSKSIASFWQRRFHWGEANTDQIFQTHHLFIDFKQAYDRVKRRELFVVKELGFETKLIRLVKATLNGTKCRVKVQNNMLEKFETREI